MRTASLPTVTVTFFIRFPNLGISENRIPERSTLFSTFFGLLLDRKNAFRGPKMGRRGAKVIGKNVKRGFFFGRGEGGLLKRRVMKKNWKKTEVNLRDI